MDDLILLYAEDEEETRKNYGNYLKRFFKEVFVVSNGQEAFKVYGEKKPAIMLLDINMPFINGLELTKKIRENDKKTRVIILTAHLEQDKLLFAAELNLTKYLPKPISRMKLKEALNEAVEQYYELDYLDSKEESNIRKLINLGENYFWCTELKKLTHNNEDIKLTKQETLLLELLSSRINRVFSSDEISIHLNVDMNEVDTSATKIKDIIKRLRKKLPKDSIENVYGAGYKLNS